MVVDHHHLGVHGTAPGDDQVTIIVIGAVATQAVVVGAGDMGKDPAFSCSPGISPTSPLSVAVDQDLTFTRSLRISGFCRWDSLNSRFIRSMQR